MAELSKKYFDSDFLISRSAREKCGFWGGFSTLAEARLFAQKYNEAVARNDGEKIGAAQIFAMVVLDEIFSLVCEVFCGKGDAFERVAADFGKKRRFPALQADFEREFPHPEGGAENKNAVRDLLLHELKGENPAESKFPPLFAWTTENVDAAAFWNMAKSFFKGEKSIGSNGGDLISFLKEPIEFSPNSLRGQLDYCLANWGDFLKGAFRRKILAAIDLFNEESKPKWDFKAGGEVPPMNAYSYEYLQNEYERFTADHEWMPRVVMLAKTVLVWLWQLSKKYGRQISRLDEIPDEELDKIAARGFNALWLIGLWRRSEASARIKKICGNPEAAASAYSLDDYEIAEDLGGWDALQGLRGRLWKRGVRLAADMVPNHTGIDSRWIAERPDVFMQRRDCPFPHYSFAGENLSRRDGIGIFLEDHYYEKTDCAVVFKRVDYNTGDVRYIYHGNDGTGLPWNDTAQIDFLNPQAREEVIQKILHVARNFPIIRFDAAMVLAKKHIRRLWYPNPGQGGDIPTRGEFALSPEEFENAIPEEFWREVVDRVAAEVPDTLLLAEAFWMLEGYFVRTLGMHRVYNSAFMNMLKKEENQKYRETVKNTLEFDPQVLRRFVNFMNNPDEETAEAQFGKGDKYFGVCTMMVTMPGLPMFGHGQIEGFSEKYGMEYRRAYRDEAEDEALLSRHEREIFPLMRMRPLFSGVENFRLYDFWLEGAVNENVFAYSNRFGDDFSLVLYNNVWQGASGWIKTSDRFAAKSGENVEMRTQNLDCALGLRCGDDDFVIFQEFRSKKWFLRKSSEIAEKGFFAILSGYEAQIFLNFREVRDGEGGKWAALCSELDGAGTDDLEIAMQNLVFGPLYKALDEFLSDEFLSALIECRYFSPNTLPKVLQKNKAAALKFFDACRGFAESEGENPPKKRAGGEKCWKNFASAEKNWLRFCRKSKAAFDKSAALAVFAAAFQAVGAAGLSREILRDWGILRRAAKIAADFCGRARSGEVLPKFDRRHLRTKKAFDFAAAMTRLAICAPNKGCESRADLRRIADGLSDGRISFAIVGKNDFGGTTWFNAEKMCDTVEIFEAALEIFSLTALEKKALPFRRRVFKTAATRAKYDWNKFLRLIDGKRKAINK